MNRQHKPSDQVSSLVEILELKVFTPPCSPGTEQFTGIAHLSADIREVLPYLNAILPGAAYQPAYHFLTWRHGDYDVACHPDRIAIGGVEDREAAICALDDIVELINRTWTRRAELTPSYQAPRRPTVMAVYKLMPATNCRLCGQSSCWSFSARLVVAQAQLADCPPLREPRHADRLAQLQAMIGPDNQEPMSP